MCERLGRTKFLLRRLGLLGMLGILGRLGLLGMLGILFNTWSLAFAEPLAKSGIMDLRDWQTYDRELPLEGEWRFYPERFINPSDLETVIHQEPIPTLQVPGAWNQFVLPNGGEFGSHGYGTYLLHIKGLPADSSLAITLRQVTSNYRLYWVPVGGSSKKPLLKNGTVGTDRASSVPQFHEFVAQLPDEHPQGEAWLIVQVSNFHWVHGGMFFAPAIRQSQAAFANFQSRFVTAVLTSGMLLMLIFYNLSLYIRQRQEKTALWLSVASSISLLSNSGYFTPVFYEMFSPSFESHRLFRYFQFCGSVVAVACYNEMFIASFPRHASRIVRWYCLLSVILFHAVHFFFPYGPPVALIRIQQVVALMIPPVILPQMFRAYRVKEEGAGLAFLGFFILFSTNLSDLLKMFRIMNTPSLVPYGYVCLSFLLSQVHANRFVNFFRKTLALGEKSEQLNRDLQIKNHEVQELNASLEIKVIERTSEINYLLQHIPQGILTIGDGGSVGTTFSAHLPQILGRSDIGGKSFKEVILDRSDLSPDRIDQAWQSILASINASPLNFEVNLDNLPKEITYQGSSPIVLKCTWNIEVSAAKLVTRILVTLLDVSSEVEAHKKLDARNRELNIVRQLIEIGTVKCKQFFSSGQLLLNENKRLIEGGDMEMALVKILFVNMHTLKGAARGLQFTEMSDVFHLVESYYSEIVRHGAAIDGLKLQSDLDMAFDIFDQYMAVNRDVLGRTEDDSKLAVDRVFLEQNLQIFQALEQNTSLDRNLKSDIRESSHQLVKLIFISLPHVLQEIMKQAGRIAQDLQKAEPLVTIESEDILMSHKNEVAIKNAFIHLLRNSLDHGIESPDVRRSKGKDPRGHIKLSARIQDEQIAIRFEDDGAGLAVRDLRSKGRDLKLIDAGASVQAVSELIFHQGMSTAKSLSQISGRGVGMDAVRRFIEGESGQVELHLGECMDTLKELYSFHIIIRLPYRTALTPKTPLLQPA